MCTSSHPPSNLHIYAFYPPFVTLLCSASHFQFTFCLNFSLILLTLQSQFTSIIQLNHALVIWRSFHLSFFSHPTSGQIDSTISPIGLDPKGMLNWVGHSGKYDLNASHVRGAEELGNPPLSRLIYPLCILLPPPTPHPHPHPHPSVSRLIYPPPFIPPPPLPLCLLLHISLPFIVK